MKKRLRIAVLCGGNSSEREVSLRSGMSVYEHLDSERFEGRLIDLRELLPGGSQTVGALVAATDVAFIALHGPGGEDGQLQGLLELMGVPYTGSGLLASALAMDKCMTKEIYRQAGLPVARDLVFAVKDVRGSAQQAASVVAQKIGWPAVVKAANQGSTRGVQIVADQAQFAQAWEDAASYHCGILVEEFVPGGEFTVPVLGGNNLEAFPIVEIVPRAADFFTYAAKYQPGGSEEIVPARLTLELADRLAGLGLAAHQALGCWGVSRTDILLSESRGPVVLETNTIPGMAQSSLLPKSLLAAGWSMTRLASSLIDWALERHHLQGKDLRQVSGGVVYATDNNR